MSTSISDLDRAPLLRLSDALADFERDADAAHSAKESGQPRGPQTGFEALDRQIGFALAPGLHGVTGNAGSGKTMLALQIAARCGFPALFVTCEMAPGELLRRHTARETKTYLGRFKSGELSRQVARDLAVRAIQASPGLCLLDATRAPATPDHIRDCARIVQGDARGVLIVLDSLQSWAESQDGKEGEYETLNKAVKVLRALAHGLNAPILFTSERNRDSMKTGGLNAGAGSRKIEYGAETVIDLDRIMKEQANGAGEVPVTLSIAKNRHGSIGVEIPLMLNGALQLFRELETAENIERATDISQYGKKDRNI